MQDTLWELPIHPSGETPRLNTGFYFEMLSLGQKHSVCYYLKLALRE